MELLLVISEECMFNSYQITLFSENQIVSCDSFRCYDDFSAMYKAQRIFNSGYFDVIDLTRCGKIIKVFKLKR